MRVVMLGPPGAGKGTQAVQLAGRLGVPHISTGDMFRQATQDQSPLGQQVRSYLEQGLLVPDELVIQVVERRLNEPDCQKGFVLDGFPRTLAQAQALDRFLQQQGQPLDAVVLLEVPDELIVERITGRRLDPQTGQIYHLRYNPPPPEVASRLVQRSDDTEETCRRRLNKYHRETEPLVPYYQQQGVLRRVDGTLSPQEVTQRILEALGVK